MRVVLTGGGSGGHTTPLVAVGQALEQLQPHIKIFVIAEKNLKAKQLGNYPTHFIYAGKFRRYHSQGLFERFKDWRTVLLNLRDIFKLAAGFFQSLALLRKLRPDVVFIKGGYVSLPVGLAAWILDIPYLTHDSDVLPGLTNRLLSGRATRNLVGFPAENYQYRRSKTIHVGIPIREEITGLTREKARAQLNLNSKQPLIVVTGGSLGAEAINKATLAVLEQLTQLAIVVHIGGPLNIESIKEHLKSIAYNPKKYYLIGFATQKMAVYLAAADVVITRAGATSLAEQAALRKASIVIPNPHLSEGHQLRNADVLINHDAARVLFEPVLQHDPAQLVILSELLLTNQDERLWLGNNLHKVFKPKAAKTIANQLIKAAHADKR